ncbi:integrase catalytic domain-containing protein [Nephila pilipes]|uniref:Integrase catalytic domain-containing protein n=1 Tax=Nephila pilipes TaxID=299642 RepID=A0A8X6QNZ2_NEPPI|nr:integrase catalytic domain-containing protein [Nephila pilipes]
MRLVESKFDFVVTGSYNDESFNEGSFSPSHCFLFKSVSNLEKTLRSFWETENISEEKPVITDELKFWEDHFERMHIRKLCGRYSVSQPFKQYIYIYKNLGDFRTIVSKHLDQLWRRLNPDPKVKVLYTQFIEEYLALGHVEEVLNINEIASDDGFFLPHHGVFRSGNRVRPLRVVFNGFTKN